MNCKPKEKYNQIILFLLHCTIFHRFVCANKNILNKNSKLCYTDKPHGITWQAFMRVNIVYWSWCQGLWPAPLRQSACQLNILLVKQVSLLGCKNKKSATNLFKLISMWQFRWTLSKYYWKRIKEMCSNTKTDGSPMFRRPLIRGVELVCC